MRHGCIYKVNEPCLLLVFNSIQLVSRPIFASSVNTRGGVVQCVALPSGRPAGDGGKMELQEEDFEALKKNFDQVCDKYNLRSEEKSSQIADFLTDQSARNFDTRAISEKFGMSMRDANTFLMWIQVGTKFKREVIDKNAELARQGLI